MILYSGLSSNRPSHYLVYEFDDIGVLIEFEFVVSVRLEEMGIVYYTEIYIGQYVYQLMFVLYAKKELDKSEDL